jgi:hypothetical protein
MKMLRICAYRPNGDFDIPSPGALKQTTKIEAQTVYKSFFSSPGTIAVVSETLI